MKGYIKTTAVGQLAADAELKYAPGGDAICEFTLAVNRSWKDKEHTEWCRCTIWGKRAESLHVYLTKGTTVLIDAEPRTETWEKGGEKKYMVKYRVNDVTLLGGGRKGAPRGAQEQQELPAQQTPARDASGDYGGGGGDVGDLPF